MNRRLIAAFALATAVVALDERASRAVPPDAGTAPPPFDAEPVPTTPSTTPTAAEWRAATPVSLSRNRTPCRAYRVREWMKVDCSHLSPAGLGEVAGPVEGVRLLIVPHDDTHRKEMTERLAEVIFPLRPGSGHVFQLLTYEYDYQVGWRPGKVGAILTDHWAAGGAPLVTMY